MAAPLFQALKILSYTTTSVVAWLRYRSGESQQSKEGVASQTAIAVIECSKGVARMFEAGYNTSQVLNVAGGVARVVDLFTDGNICEQEPSRQFERTASKVLGVYGVIVECVLLNRQHSSDALPDEPPIWYDEYGDPVVLEPLTVEELQRATDVLCLTELTTRHAGVSRTVEAVTEEIALSSSSTCDMETNTRRRTGASDREQTPSSPLAGMSSILDSIFQAVKGPSTPREREISGRLGIHPERGLLLYGPPGTGKTTLAKHVADRLGCSNINHISCGEVKTKWIGDTEKNIRALFVPALESYERYGEDAPLHAVILDELEGILSTRTNGGESGERWANGFVDEFLVQIDQLNTLPNLIIIGITNHKDAIDQAILRSGRLGLHIHIDLPNLESRREIFGHYTAPLMAVRALADDVDVDQLAVLSDGLSGADIKGVVGRVKEAARDHLLQNLGLNLESLITQDNFVQGLNQFFGERDLGSARKLDFFGRDQLSDIVGGMEEQLATLRREILDLRGPQGSQIAQLLGLSPPKGVLLWGPSGTGKTTLAAGLVKELGCDSRHVQLKAGPELVSSQRGGGTERNIRRLFDPARASFEREGNEAPLHVIIIDEIEEIVGARSAHSSVCENRAVDQFLDLLDGGNPLPNVLVIGITNHIERIDPAILRPGRLGLHLYLGHPDEEARGEIFRISVRESMEQGLLGADVDFQELSRLTDGFTGADIKDIIRRAKTRVVARLSPIVKSTPTVSLAELPEALMGQDDIVSAIQSLRESRAEQLDLCLPARLSAE